MFARLDGNYKLLGKFEKSLEISIENLKFYLKLGKIVAKIELSEITSFFYTNFFRFGGGGLNPPP